MSLGTVEAHRRGHVEPMEPRLRARRIEVARDQGRRRLRRLAVLGAIVGVVAGAVGLALSPVLDVDRIEVAGAANSGDDAVRAASGISSGDALVALDLGAAVAGVEQLPWVASASVRRAWPGTVEIEVVERVPLAMVGSGGSAVLVAADGTVLGPAGDATLPALSGRHHPAGSVLPERQRGAVAILAELPATLRSQVVRVRTTGSPANATTTLVLRDGIVVRWGGSDQSTAKADALEVLLSHAGRSTIEVIDVSVPRAAAVTRQGDGA